MKNETKTTEQQASVPPAAASGPDGNKQHDALAALRAENEKLKDKLRHRDAHDDLTHKLKKAGARTPKLLFEAAKHALKFTTEGLLENAGDLVEDLKGRFPEQFGHDEPVRQHASIDAGSGRAAQPTLTREQLAKMTPAEIAKLDWADVRRALSN